MENDWMAVEQRRWAKEAAAPLDCSWRESQLARLNTVQMVGEEMAGGNIGRNESWGWKMETLHMKWGSPTPLLYLEELSYSNHPTHLN